MKNLIIIIIMCSFSLNGISQITAAEYFLDGVDPGVGNATALTITTGNPISENFNILTNGLSNGIHSLYVRVKNANNTWSLYKRAFFYIQNNDNNTQQNITQAEYFIDGIDPGVGNAIALAINLGNPISENFTIPTNGLTNGIHSLHIRIKDNGNTWSLYKRAFFYVQDASNITAIPITAAEYFLDTDPGVGNGTVLTLIQGLNINESFTITIPTPTTDGNHYLYIRVQDQNNNWSLYKRALLTIDNSLSIEELDSNNIKIYPNPVQNSLHIDLLQNTNYSYRIFNLNGKEISYKNNLNTTNQVNMSNYSSGLYFIKLINKSNQNIKILKFIKQ